MVDTFYVPNVGEIAQQGGTPTTDLQGRSSAPSNVTANAGTNLNTSLLALEAGHLSTIDTSTAASKTDLDTIVTQTLTPNVSDRWARQLGQVDLARVLGAALSSTNPMLTQAQISAMCVAGQGFCYSTGKNTLGTTSTMGLQVFNPVTSTKNVLIYRVYQWLNGGNVAAELRMTTAIDTALTTAAVVANMKGGGGGSGIPSPTVNISFALTGITIPGQSASSSFVGGGISGTLIQSELLTNGMTILLPAGVASGLVLYSLFSAAGPAEFAIYGVEY